MPQKRFLKRKQTYALVKELGLFPFSYSYFQKLCATSVGLGPP
jgi:hypothetical protein